MSSKSSMHLRLPQLAFIVVIIFASAMLSGCEKELPNPSNNPPSSIAVRDTSWRSYPLDTIPAEVNENVPHILTFPSSSYVSVPGNNVYQSSPTSSVYFSPTTYYGGPFQFCTYSVGTNSVTFQLKRTDGYTFPVNSVLRIKLNNAGGQIVNTVVVTSAFVSCTITIPETNTWNVGGGNQSNSLNTDTYVATWYNPVSGYNFYCQPIKIVAVPTGWGTYLGYFGVPIYSNGWGGFLGTDYLRDASCNNSQTYQCVHFIQKYYLTVKNRNIGNAGAADYWINNSSHSLPSKVTNGNGIPQPNDVICFYNNSSGSYHVGIVASVGATIRVFHENVGQTYNSSTGTYCSSFKDMPFTNTGTGYNISATLLGANWITLGWVR
jgi:hypothetical protein